MYFQYNEIILLPFVFCWREVGREGKEWRWGDGDSNFLWDHQRYLSIKKEKILLDIKSFLVYLVPIFTANFTVVWHIFTVRKLSSATENTLLLSAWSVGSRHTSSPSSALGHGYSIPVKKESRAALKSQASHGQRESMAFASVREQRFRGEIISREFHLICDFSHAEIIYFTKWHCLLTLSGEFKSPCIMQHKA